VRKITDNAEDAAIVRSLIAMAHNLGIAVIAEGVETSTQAAFLLNEQCEEGQGFLYAKPLPAAEFAEYLKTREPALQEARSVDQEFTANRQVRRLELRSSSRRRSPRA
jgi:sensor c-di-GMP phosphodiesterase-like protein